jgi:hypothetical protein
MVVDDDDDDVVASVDCGSVGVEPDVRSLNGWSPQTEVDASSKALAVMENVNQYGVLHPTTIRSRWRCGH